MKKFNVGIIGYGWAAGAHIAAINAGERGQVTAVCSARPLDAAALSAEHGSPIRVYNDLDAMLADSDVHVISVCSYHRQHKEHVLAAARAGKHLIVEKPLALSWPDVREIEAAVRAAGVRLCICFELRFAAQFRETRALLDRGEIGSLHYAEVDYYHGIGPWYREYQWCTTNEGCGSSLLDNRLYSTRLHGDDRQRWAQLPFNLVDSGDVADHPYRTQFDQFFEALDQGRDMPLTGLADAVRTHRVLFAADHSWRERRPVRIEEMS